jgi:hypothetical protein
MIPGTSRLEHHPYIKEGAKLPVVHKEIPTAYETHREGNGSSFLLGCEGKQSGRVGNQAPLVRKRIQAPVWRPGLDLRISGEGSPPLVRKSVDGYGNGEKEIADMR